MQNVLNKETVALYCIDIKNALNITCTIWFVLLRNMNNSCIVKFCHIDASEHVPEFIS